MAFAGYLLKFGETEFPNEYIAAGSYKVTPNQIIDEDSYTDGDGVLHRNTLPHTRTKIEFSTPYISLATKTAIQAILSNRTTISATYWNDEDDEYQTGTFYIPDITFEIYTITSTDITYMPVRIALIEY